MSDTKPDFTGAIAQLRLLAATSADNALTEGPVNADRQLLDLCADALHSLVHAERAQRAGVDALHSAHDSKDYQNRRAVWEALGAEAESGVRNAKPMMYRIRKLKATTAAGIYAKAAVVRASKTGAADLAMSLAQDLLDCPGLRASLWPAGEGG
jgi:hypothetical protein